MATPLSVSVNALHDEQVISSLSHCTSPALGGAREVDTGDRWTQRHSAPPRDIQGTSRYEFGHSSTSVGTDPSGSWTEPGDGPGTSDPYCR